MGRKWMIADFDYFYHTGNPTCTKHHVLLVPDTPFPKVPYITTSSGYNYADSNARTEGLRIAKELIYELFGQSHVMVHYDSTVNTINETNPDDIFFSVVWAPMTIELLSLEMLYPQGRGYDYITSPSYACCGGPLQLFASAQDVLSSNGDFFLRTITLDKRVMVKGSSGRITADVRITSNYIVPYVCICE